MAVELPPFAQAVPTARCLRLVTYRRDGTPVATPVWFVPDGPDLLVWTGAGTGKVRRLRHTPRITVATCTMRGTPTSAERPATGHLLPAEDGPRIDALLSRRYGWQKRLLDLINSLLRRLRRRPPAESAYLRIVLD